MKLREGQMANPGKDRPKRAKREKLSAERIAEAAMQLIDEGGLDNFSFRSLAKRLGCQAMSIYHYYPSKAHLLEALVDMCLSEIAVPDPALPWRARLGQIAQSMRQVALRHPGFFLYFSIFRMNNRAGMTMLNSVLQILEDIGLDAANRARAFRSFSYYIMGAGVDEALGYAHGPSAVAPVPQDEAERAFPAIMAVGRYFGDDYHGEIFDYGVEAMLDRIEADVRAAEADRG
jgi:AcrR family transcriptional regulator